MSSTLEAVNVLAGLTTTALRSLEAAQQVSALVQRAQTEQRDLTDAEIQQVRAARQAAMARWAEG